MLLANHPIVASMDNSCDLTSDCSHAKCLESTELAIYYDKHFSSEDEAIREKVKTIAGQNNFSLLSLLHNYDAQGPTDSLESAVCRGREPKIAASDCHTIGLG